MTLHKLYEKTWQTTYAIPLSTRHNYLYWTLDLLMGRLQCTHLISDTQETLQLTNTLSQFGWKLRVAFKLQRTLKQAKTPISSLSWMELSLSTFKTLTMLSSTSMLWRITIKHGVIPYSYLSINGQICK